MPRNELFDESRKRLGGLYNEAQEPGKEIDPAKLSSGDMLKLARQGRAQRSGASKQKGVASGLRGDVTQALGQAAGMIAGGNQVVAANPQQMRGMRFDPRTRGGTRGTPSRKAAPAMQKTVEPEQTDPTRDFTDRGRGGADARAGGAQGHVAGGGMKGYSEMGMDDSMISSAQKTQAQSTAWDRSFGTDVMKATIGMGGIKTGVFGGLLASLGVPAGMIADMLPGMFMKGVFSPTSAGKILGVGYQHEKIRSAYQEAMGPDVDLGSKEAKDKMMEAKEKGLWDKGQAKAYFEQEKATSPQGDFEGITKDIEGPGETEAEKADRELTEETTGTNVPVDQWEYNPDMSTGGEGDYSSGGGDYGGGRGGATESESDPSGGMGGY